MRFSLEKKPEENQAVMEIELPEEEVARALERAYRRLVRRITVPGFRRGRVPRPIFERFVGKDQLYTEALDELVPNAWSAAVSESGLRPLGTPSIQIIQMEEGKPLRFRATVELYPEVKLPEYRSFEVRRRKVTVTEEQVDEVLHQLARRRGGYEKVDEPARPGCHVVVDYEGRMNGERVEALSEQDVLMEVGSSGFPSPFDATLEGMQAGDTRRCEIRFPDDHPARGWAGKKVEFTITVKEVRRRHIPELNDEFAQSFGFANLEELRANYKSMLLKTENEIADQEVQEQLFQRLVEEAEVDLPESLVEREVDFLIQELEDDLKRRSLSLEDHLRLTDMTLAELRQQTRPRAARRVRTRLVAQAFAEAEGLEVSDEEVESAVQRRGLSTASRQRLQEMELLRREIRNDLFLSKILRRLMEVARVMEADESAEGEGSGVDNSPRQQ